MQLPGGELDIDELIFDLEWLPADGERPGGGYYNSQVQVTHVHTSWGADGSTVEAILNIGLGLSASVIYDILKALFKKYGGSARHGTDSRDWSDDEIIQRVASMLARQSGIAATDILTVGIERMSDRSAATVEFNAAGKRHTLSIRIVADIPIIESHSREM